MSFPLLASLIVLSTSDSLLLFFPPIIGDFIIFSCDLTSHRPFTKTVVPRFSRSVLRLPSDRSLANRVLSDDLRRFPTVQPALHPFWIAYHRICLKVSCFAIPCLIYLITFQVGNSLDLFAIYPILCCCPLRLFPIFLVYIYQVFFLHVPLMFVFQVLYFCMYHF